MEICQSAMRVGVGGRGQGGTCQLQKWNQIWAAVWEDWEEETNHSLRSDIEHDGLGWWGEGAAGEWEKKEKGEGEKQQRRGQKVGEEGGDMKCEFKFI